jgi:midasin (ATPase involved in ribosome maturation)
MSSYLQTRVDLILNEMERDVFRHFSVSGDEGSGKMSFIELLSDSFHNKEEEDPSTKLIVVTLEETFDSKILVGTYVCNESGEFVFKKGPLTDAEEEGLWLVLRHIEEAPSDLLSYLLPLV